MKKILKKLLKFIVIFLSVAVALYLISFTIRYMAAQAFRKAEWPDGTKHVRVAGADYDIPIGYFARRIPYYIESTDIYLKVFWPDFIVQPMSNAELMKQGKRDYVLRILAHDPRYIKDMDRLGESSFRITSYSSQITGTLFGLDTYTFDPAGVRDHGEPFTRQENGHYVTIIRCANDVLKGESSEFPRICTHYFTDGYLLYQISYMNKPYLGHWQEIETKTKALFADFRKAAKDKRYDQVIVPDKRIDSYYKDRLNEKPVNPDFKLPEGEQK